jgi:hypothetical protein
MIRLPIKLKDLRDQITALDGNWFTRAKTKADAAALKGKIEEGDGIWSDIKAVYMEHQGHKCMYCEKPMPREAPGGVAQGKGEYDVEHFRPKNRVTHWPTAAVKQKRLIDYEAQLKDGVPNGYLRLAFDPWNYGVSCKTCNSELKGDRFPIIGKASATAKTRTALDKAEVPCLILPIGDEGEDPEGWLEWHGPIVAAGATLDPATTLRARTLIDFFELDTRGDLLELRCVLITNLFARLEKMGQPAPIGPAAKQYVDSMTEPKRLFAGCLRGFVKLFDKDPAAARKWNDIAEQYLMSRDPRLFS